MAPSKSTKPIPQRSTKEKVFHPFSRKAGQLQRTALRKGRLGDLTSKRSKKHNSLVDVYGFFFHALPEEGVFTLDELHSLIRDVWLVRHDSELEQEKALRRKGRPKSAKETRIEDIVLREAEEYRTGLEIIDLTDDANVQLFRRWDQKEVAYVQQLRHIRISSQQPATAIVSRLGKHPLLIDHNTDGGEEPEVREDTAMEDSLS